MKPDAIYKINKISMKYNKVLLSWYFTLWLFLNLLTEL